MITFEPVTFHGLNCKRLANGVIDLVITADIGPRILRCGFIDQPNFFAELPYAADSSDFQFYGGHRFWHAPEHPVRTYYPDNAPLTFQQEGNRLRIVQDTETTTGLQKIIDITLDQTEAKVTVAHHLCNRNLFALKLAPWALSMMTTNGIGIMPLPERGSHEGELLPTSTLSLWPYTNLSDPRWTFGKQYILLQQDPTKAAPQKIGASSSQGWLGYAVNEQLFVKTFDQSGSDYPDLNASAEMFTNGAILELESLAPLKEIGAESAVSLTETWHLFDNIPSPKTDADIDTIRKKIAID